MILLTGIPLAVGLADDDLLPASLLMPGQVATFFVAIGALLILFALIDKARYGRKSPVQRMLWRRRRGLRAWR